MLNAALSNSIYKYLCLVTQTKKTFTKIRLLFFLGFKHGYLKGVIGVEYALAEAKEAQIEVREHKQGSKGKIIINI